MLAIDRYPGQTVVIDDALFIIVIGFNKTEVEIKFECTKKDSIWIGADQEAGEKIIKIDESFLLTQHIDLGINYLMFSGKREWQKKSGEGKIMQARLAFNCEKKYKIWRKEIWGDIDKKKRIASGHKPLQIGV